ncbi:MAG: hypothetical protein H6735_00175 [Alphaproteobacteria bacterium]|nr:hypothetical protein [Alphaproteobacteria bacterium]
MLRFVMAYISTPGLDAIGADLLVAALRKEHSLGVASLACACGFEPLIALEGQVGRDPANLKYFLDPGIADPDSADPNLSMLHSKLVYVVRADGKAVVYLGSHNWSSRALGGSGSTRNAEASFRIEVDFVEDHLSGVGTGLGANVNRHILACYRLGACLPARNSNRPIFEDWFRVRCKRPTDLDLDGYAVVVGIAGDSVPGAANPDFWAKEARQGASIYLQCHEEEEGQVVRKRQERVLAMVWAGPDAFAKALPPVLLFCKVTRQAAGQESTYEGTSQGDIANFRFVLWDPQQDGARGAGRTPGPRLRMATRTGTSFDYFAFDLAAPGSAASTFDRAAPRYQHYLQVYEVVVPAWMADGSEAADGPPRLVWQPVEFALSPTRQVPPEEQRQYRAPEDTADQILASLTELFGVDIEQAVALPTSGETDPRKLVRLVTSKIHEACIDEATEALQTAFYAKAAPGGIVMRLADRSHPREAHDLGEFVPRVQELFGDRLRSLLQRLGVEHPDVEEWEAKPTARRASDLPKKPKKVVQDQADVQVTPESKPRDEDAVTTLRPPNPAEVLAALQTAVPHVLKGGVAGRRREEVVEAIIQRTFHVLGRDPGEPGLRETITRMLARTRLGQT